ncbi:Glutamyl/glutaminyl-tRNA synthetase class Ib [Penicillium brevicompactum]|uniref:glutamate--tRNA ligase n=1 Tax=Penicillium brevicompactum TaxID=5074 RepID=A0A9W9RKV3_PENBR|nr:Glutamyl/glutaminyl-tRNA synthetase class Ib [Penicillium brevicompactum]
MTRFDLFVATGATQALLLPAVLIALFINEASPYKLTILFSPRSKIIDITFVDDSVLGDDEKSIICLQSDGKSITGTAPIIQHLYANFPFLVGKDSQAERVWISQLESFEALDFKVLDPILQRLDAHLLLRSFVTGYSLSTPDIAIWGAIRGNRVAAAAIKKGSLVNLTRWYEFVQDLSREKKIAKAKEGASYDIALNNTENGVVTRFPPEPSGYLHIGHAKAALLVCDISTDPSTGKVTHLDLELHLAGDVKKTEKKVTWLSTEGQTLVPVELVDFDYLLNKDSLAEEDILEDVLNFNTEFRVDALADSNVSDVQVGDIIQFDRKGFYRVDRVPAIGVPGVFFSVPTGKQK